MVRASNENMPMKILLFALVLLASQGAAADTLSGRVVGVADGDTLKVLDQDAQSLGMDTGTTRPASGDDPQVATVGGGDRAAHGRG